MGKARKNASMANDQSKEQKKRSSQRHTKSKELSIFHLKNSDLETKFQTYKGRVVFRGDTVKDDSGSHAVFTEQCSSASQMTAAEVMDVIVRVPGCAGQAADAVSAYTQVKIEDAPKFLKIPESGENDNSATTAAVMRMAATTAAVPAPAATTAAGTPAAATTAAFTAAAATTVAGTSTAATTMAATTQFRCRLRGDIGGDGVFSRAAHGSGQRKAGLAGDVSPCLVLGSGTRKASIGMEHAVWNSQRTDHNRGTGGRAVGTHLSLRCHFGARQQCPEILTSRPPSCSFQVFG